MTKSPKDPKKLALEEDLFDGDDFSAESTPAWDSVTPVNPAQGPLFLPLDPSLATEVTPKRKRPASPIPEMIERIPIEPNPKLLAFIQERNRILEAQKLELRRQRASVREVVAPSEQKTPLEIALGTRRRERVISAIIKIDETDDLPEPPKRPSMIIEEVA